MTARRLPASDVYATCPHDGPVLSFYEGTFESIYVLLHPFMRPVTISAERLRNDESLGREAILASCEPVSWLEIRNSFGFESLAKIDIALRTQIGGLKEEFASPLLAARLRTCTEQAGIVEPNEGTFSELSHDKVLSFVQELGYEWVWVGDEFCTERKLLWIEDLKKPTSTATLGNRNVFTPDKRVLWTTHWDSHFSFFCGSNEVIKKLDSDARFEGFECATDTEVYWSVR